MRFFHFFSGGGEQVEYMICVKEGRGHLQSKRVKLV